MTDGFDSDALQNKMMVSNATGKRMKSVTASVYEANTNTADASA